MRIGSSTFQLWMEVVVDRLLALDEEGRARLAGTGETLLEIAVTRGDGARRFAVRLEGGAVEVGPAGVIEPDVSLSGPLSAFRTLCLEFRIPGDGSLSVDGDRHRLEQILAALRSFDLDWEELLSGLVGDVPAHHLGGIAKGLGKAFGRAQEKLSEGFREYVEHDSGLLPSRIEWEEYVRDVMGLSLRIERLEAGLNPDGRREGDRVLDPGRERGADRTGPSAGAREAPPESEAE